MNNNNDLTPPEKLLKACHTSLELCEQTRKLQSEALTKQGEVLDAQSKRIDELEKSQPNRGFWFILGSIFTGLIFFLVK